MATIWRPVRSVYVRLSPLRVQDIRTSPTWRRCICTVSAVTNLETLSVLDAARNRFGHVDIRGGVPAGLVHLPSPAAARTCLRLGIGFARAIVGFRTSRYGSSPQFRGGVVNASDAQRLPPPRSHSTGKRTLRELANLSALNFDELFAQSVKCLHALNRRAKRYPATSSAIYALKNRFLRAAVAAGVADVERFTLERLTGYFHLCDCDGFDGGTAGRSWYSGSYESYCRACGDRSFGEPQKAIRVWYLVRVLGHGFHQPGPADPVLDAVAVSVEPHDPTNYNSEIPKIGLTIAAQQRCVELATAGLMNRVPAEVVPERAGS